MKISGFTFIHNALESGYPIREVVQSIVPFVYDMVIVDMQSTDGTREILDNMAKSKFLSVRIINGEWGNEAGETLAKAHALHTECAGDVIIHAEGDEVYNPHLLGKIRFLIKQGYQNISVQRIQIEQNFQRVRWYPHWVHRVFPKGTVTKNGETTHQKDCEDMFYVDGKWGYLWDCTNCFKEQWLNRIQKQSELRNGEQLNTLYAPEHINLPNRLDLNNLQEFLDNPMWAAKTTPLNIPYILRDLVGVTKYE